MTRGEFERLVEDGPFNLTDLQVQACNRNQLISLVGLMRAEALRAEAAHESEIDMLAGIALRRERRHA